MVNGKFNQVLWKVPGSSSQPRSWAWRETADPSPDVGTWADTAAQTDSDLDIKKSKQLWVVSLCYWVVAHPKTELERWHVGCSMMLAYVSLSVSGIVWCSRARNIRKTKSRVERICPDFTTTCHAQNRFISWHEEMQKQNKKYLHCSEDLELWHSTIEYLWESLWCLNPLYIYIYLVIWIC